jgi:hypothetical protein
MACATRVPTDQFSSRSNLALTRTPDQEAIEKLSLRKHPVRIANPVQGGSNYTSPLRAIRFIKARRAYLDATNRLVFYGEIKGKTGAGLDVVDRFSGLDAFPERAVYPPSPEVLARMTSGSKQSVKAARGSN